MQILDRSLSRFPRPVRTLIDWSLTIAVAIVAILIFQAEVAKPYRIPTSSMEPTLHCGKPGEGCRSRVSDRVIANRIVYRFHSPERGDIIVFNAPQRVGAACNASGTFVKRIVGLPGEHVAMKSGQVLINGVRLREPYSPPPIAAMKAVSGPEVLETATSCSATTAPCRATHAGGASFRAETSSAALISGTGRQVASATRSDEP